MEDKKGEITITYCPKRYATGYIEPLLLPEDEIKIKPDPNKKGETWFKIRR
jgi:hypothetical protein